MSTKIYTAWRCPAAQFETALAHTRETVFRQAVRRVRTIMAQVTEEQLARTNLTPFSDQKARACAYALRCTRWAALQAHREPAFDIDCSLNIWFYKKHAYVIPHGESCTYKWRTPPVAEAFGYWNNTDKPARVSERAWAQRGAIWDAVCLENWDQTRLTHTILDGRDDKCVGYDELIRTICDVDPTILLRRVTDYDPVNPRV